MSQHIVKVDGNVTVSPINHGHLATWPRAEWLACKPVWAHCTLPQQKLPQWAVSSFLIKRILRKCIPQSCAASVAPCLWYNDGWQSRTSTAVCVSGIRNPEDRPRTMAAPTLLHCSKLRASTTWYHVRDLSVGITDTGNGVLLHRFSMSKLHVLD